MTHNPAFMVAKFSWTAAAREVSRIAGKAYSAQYIREVAKGFRTNKQLFPILKELGLTDSKAA